MVKSQLYGAKRDGNRGINALVLLLLYEIFLLLDKNTWLEAWTMRLFFWIGSRLRDGHFRR
jgi:hypothetical protein